jgi:predicted PurR-regulated permease PerM
MGLPYNVLISVIIGVTNIIPFFGPFIGAIPSTIIILLESPIQAVYFVIFVLILQQVDGNIIGPKILGDSTGIPSFWVIFAILFGAGLFGFVGMLVGIPIFAIIYHYIGRWTRHKLRKRNMPTETAFYRDMSNYTSERLLGSKKKKTLK